MFVNCFKAANVQQNQGKTWQRKKQQQKTRSQQAKNRAKITLAMAKWIFSQLPSHSMQQLACRHNRTIQFHNQLSLSPCSLALK